MIRRENEVRAEVIANCHKGSGDLLCRMIVGKADGLGDVTFIHDDVIEPGASIGEHHHDHPELYYVMEGSGVLLFDGEKIPVVAGDLSVVTKGHSHGIINAPDAKMRLLVVGCR